MRSCVCTVVCSRSKRVSLGIYLISYLLSSPLGPLLHQAQIVYTPSLHKAMLRLTIQLLNCELQTPWTKMRRFQGALKYPQNNWTAKPSHPPSWIHILTSKPHCCTVLLRKRWFVFSFAVCNPMWPIDPARPLSDAEASDSYCGLRSELLGTLEHEAPDAGTETLARRCPRTSKPYEGLSGVMLTGTPRPRDALEKQALSPSSRNCCLLLYSHAERLAFIRWVYLLFLTCCAAHLASIACLVVLRVRSLSVLGPYLLCSSWRCCCCWFVFVLMFQFIYYLFVIMLLWLLTTQATSWELGLLNYLVIFLIHIA